MSQDNKQVTELKGKELAFALAFIELGPVTGRNAQAAVKAGYAKNSANQTAYKLLKKPHVAAYVRAKEQMLLQNIEDKQLVTREAIIAKLETIYERSMQEVEVKEYDPVEKKMVGIGEYVFDGKTAVRCAELLGKTIGMFTDKKLDKPTDPFNLIINLSEEQKQQKTIENQQTCQIGQVADLPTINL